MRQSRVALRAVEYLINQYELVLSMLNRVHPHHPQPEVCEACKLLDRTAGPVGYEDSEAKQEREYAPDVATGPGLTGLSGSIKRGF